MSHEPLANLPVKGIWREIQVEAEIQKRVGEQQSERRLTWVIGAEELSGLCAGAEKSFVEVEQFALMFFGSAAQNQPHRGG